MNNDQLLSERLSFHQLLSEKKISIEIPIIQRDYAQGRDSASQVRSDFLDALYGYLSESNTSRDLDFVYGDVENGKFIPLDGQQRLTTLFLLHWYTALKDGKYDDFKGLLLNGQTSRFTYKTRTSSHDFCNAMLINGIDIDNLLSSGDDANKSISKTIRDSFWFYISWEKDPTVQSMLKMLDSIHEKFNQSTGLYSKLTSCECPAITFRFLPLKNHGLSEDLYIKMNSRGKPLTKFENFKARFEQHLSSRNIFTGKYVLKSEGGNQAVDIKTYFSHQMDTQWTDLFWNFRVSEKDITETGDVEYNIDALMMNFITTLAINHYALNYLEVRDYIDNQDELPLGFYTGLNDEFVLTLISVLDVLSSGSKLKTFFRNFHYYKEQEMFKNIIENRFGDAAYYERIVFYAYYSFLSLNAEDHKGFKDWMRVIANLARNTMPYNNDGEFINSIRAVHDLLPYSSDIYKYLSSPEYSTLGGFNPIQIKEERIKAHLIDKNKDWIDSIIRHETHEYFKGQLTFSLAFSGIEEYYDNNDNCGWPDKDDKAYFSKFNEYIRKTYSLFGPSGINTDAQTDFRLHRAILSKGDYLLYAKANYSFLNDSDRDVSWKRYLQGDGYRKQKREHFKSLLDETLFDTDDLGSLEKIAHNYDKDIESWRRAFIENPEIFNYLGNYLFIRFESNEEVYLLARIKMSGEHAELYSYCLYNQLKNDPFFENPAPFSSIGYYYPSGDDYKPFMYLNAWITGENHFDLYCSYNGAQQYKLKLLNQNESGIPRKISDIFKKTGFIHNKPYYEKVVDSTSVKKDIKLFCETLCLELKSS